MAWVLDKAHSSVQFAVKHMMISTVRGKFTDSDGMFNLDENDLAHSYIEGNVKAASIDTGDPNRDAHLRSPDFFDVEKYPNIAFKSTRVESKGHERYHVTGNLTIKDVTHEVTFDANEEGKGKDPWGKDHWGFIAELSFNRKDFGLGWNVALEAGGWLVGEHVKVTIDLELVNQPEPAPAAAATA